MKRIIILLMCSFFVFGVNAQDKEKKTKEKAEKTAKESKDKKSKDKKAKGKDDADIFIGEPEGDKYQLDQRREVSKPEMPVYDENQEFNSQKKKNKQQEAFIGKEYYFPAKPKNAWQVGVRGGLAMLNGDISQNFFKGNKPFVPGYTFGVYAKKSWNYMFSTRLSYSFMEMWNSNSVASTVVPQFVMPTNLASEYATNDLIFHNSHTVGHDATLDLMVSFGNKKYHKERTKVLFNVFVSAGAMIYSTWYDQLDEFGNGYDYNTIQAGVLNGDSKKDINKALTSLRNGVYETRAEGQTSGDGFLGNNTFTPVFGGGAGITFRVNRVIDLDFEARLMATTDDLVDGQQWEETGTLTREFDTYATTTIGMNFKLVGKKKTEPTTLLNPMHYSYQKLAENDPEEAINELLKDDDEDGVPNRLDEEDDTPAGAPVSPKGIALDSDGDGVIDLNDDEPFSPPGLPVDAKGIAQLPPVDPMANANALFNCDADIALPSVHFDKDKYNVQPEFYAHLHNVAERMISCPNMVVSATGMTDKDDNEKYNEQLSFNRVNAVIDYLNTNYGIDRNRFVVNFAGESNANGTSKIQQYEERKVSLEQVTDGSTGSGNVAPPHPGIKAGTNE